jgi:hypothetical protein
MSENGKNIFYGAKGSPLRDSMENIYTLSQKFKELRPFQNTSGTAHSAAWFELGLFAHDMGILQPIGQLLGANQAAKFLTRQTSARTVSRWMTAVYNSMTKGGGAAAIKLTTMNLAREIADQNGGDERDIEAKLQQVTPGMRS